MRRTSTFIHPFIVFLFCTVWATPYKGWSQGASGKDPVAFELAHRNANTQVMPEGISKSWYNEAVAKIEEREYFVRTTDRARSFAAINHAQHLGYLFSEKGYTVSNFNDDGSDKGIWRTNFIFEGIGRKDRLHVSPLRHVSQMGDLTVQYDHNDYAITYDNRRQGMEQSFIVKKRPAGHSELQLVLGLDGDLQAKMGKGDQLLLTKTDDPQDVKLAYDNFKVWDANKKPLTAHMHLTTAHRLVLTVDDRHATYPLTVDPLSHNPNFTFDVANLLGNVINEATSPVLAGYSVTGVSDVNGDGTDEVVIGAPLFTTVSGITSSSATLVAPVKGAVFVYYGVFHALPSNVPSQVLQPSTLSAGALFGFSLASADLNDDGRGDIIVGAPTDASPFLPTVRTGNVYIYSGASLTNNVDVIPAEVQKLVYGTPLDVIGLVSDIFFGFSLAGGGHLNAGTIDDLVVGIPGLASGTGRVQIYHGLGAGSFVSPSPNGTINGTISTGLFGYSVSCGGNVNGDAFDDLVVGAPGTLVSSSGYIGAAYVFHGASGGIAATSSALANKTLSAPNPGLFTTLFGFSVAMGDFNHDLISDVIIGEPFYVTGGGAPGRAHIYYGAALGLGSTPFTLNSPRLAAGLNLLFGYSVGAANVTGDLADDAIVGEPGGLPLTNTGALSSVFSTLGISLSTPATSGAAYIYKGLTTFGILGGAAPFWTFNNSSGLPNDLIGARVCGVGDVNGDGFPDFIVGAPSGSLDLSTSFSNLASNLSLTVGAGLFKNNQQGNTYLFIGFTNALPLTLLTFTATADNGNTLLNWSTAQEQNTDHFEIERSTDGVHFNNIGQVAASNNSSVKTDYSWTDASPAVGTNYYRLKMMDLDGQFTYSEIAIVKFQAGGPSTVAAYPNPAHGSFNLVFKNMAPGAYRMTLVNVVGQEVMMKQIQVSNPIRHNESVNLPGLAPGSYWIRLIDRQDRSTLSRLEIR